MTLPFSYVLNVVAAGHEADDVAAELRVTLARTGGAGEIEWLSPHRAFDIAFESNPHVALNEARAVAQALPIDVNVVAADNRRKKLLIADMDSTIIDVECLDELADMAGLKPVIAEITERAMRGELVFEDALRERVAMLKGLELAALDRVYQERIRLNPGAKTLLATMRAHGAHTLLVSGGFRFFTSRVAQAAGFHGDQANELLHEGGLLTGKVAEPILGREAKLAALEQSAATLGIDASDALAVGDGANDLAMIQRAGLGVAYHAKPIVAAAAGASVGHGDLTALLYLQGYRDEEFVGAAT